MQLLTWHMTNADPICMIFGKRLRDLRNVRGLSQETLSLSCGFDRTYISGVERGVRNPGLRNLARIAAGLKMDLSELFDGIKSG